MVAWSFPEVFCKVCSEKLTKFTRKHLCRSLFLIKLWGYRLYITFPKKKTPAQMFSCEFWEIPQNTLFMVVDLKALRSKKFWYAPFPGYFLSSCSLKFKVVSSERLFSKVSLSKIRIAPNNHKQMLTCGLEITCLKIIRKPKGKHLCRSSASVNL